MLVLGVDPGLAITGYGLVRGGTDHQRLVEFGVIRSRPKDPMEKRVGAIFSGMIEILEEMHPDIVSMEDLYSHIKHPKTAVIMAHARGAILAAADSHGIPVINYSATKIKSALTGNGRARKEQVRQMVMSMLNMTEIPEPIDKSDALAAAICHINQNQGVPTA
ncbi:MAG: crossover junction endodeoxyribonuclease RuvC [FCB group bacterium]|nr:crossover junction endodeoxyribonuclease RuvC [FCB group bacterium]